MKKFGVVHARGQHELVDIEDFHTKPEAETYVKDFATKDRDCSMDRMVIIENLGEFESKVIDQTEDSILYGFKEKK